MVYFGNYRAIEQLFHACYTLAEQCGWRILGVIFRKTKEQRESVALGLFWLILVGNTHCGAPGGCLH